MNWTMNQITAAGMMPMNPQPDAQIDPRWGFSLSARQRFKIHGAFRVIDYDLNQTTPKWIACRWIDPAKATKYDSALSSSLLPKTNNL